MEKLKDLFIEEIERLLPENIKDRLTLAMRYMFLAPAKYIRPFLVIASSSVFGVEVKEALPVAIAVEFIHVYSLIHDDLPCMDNSDTRRGQPSCHKKFDEATAMLAGDALLTLAFEVLSSLDTDSNKRCEIIKVLSKAIGTKGMIGGQVLDIRSSIIKVADTEIKNENACGMTLDQASDKIKEIHLMKTAKLFATSCEVGAIMGNAADKQRRALYCYGMNLGLIFQAKDDISDYGQDKTNNLVSVLGKGRVKNYIENLVKQALDNLSALSGNTDYLYSLLNQIKQ